MAQSPLTLTRFIGTMGAEPSAERSRNTRAISSQPSGSHALTLTVARESGRHAGSTTGPLRHSQYGSGGSPIGARAASRRDRGMAVESLSTAAMAEPWREPSGEHPITRRLLQLVARLTTPSLWLPVRTIPRTCRFVNHVRTAEQRECATEPSHTNREIPS